MSWLAEYAFLISSNDDITALATARAWSERWGVSLLDALFAIDDISPERYTLALATACGVAMATSGVTVAAETASRARRTPSNDLETPLAGAWRDRPVVLICATDADPATIRRRLVMARSLHGEPTFVTARILRAAAEQAQSSRAVKAATSALKRKSPDFSAGNASPPWQRAFFPVIAGLAGGAFTVHPTGTVTAVLALLTIPFAGTVLVRLIAMAFLFRPTRDNARTQPRLADQNLPTYSIMVALYDEAPILPALVAALSRLDFPPAKLDCLLVIEDVDTATKAALLDLELPAFMRVIVVPEGVPRTKPRALNYALHLARGDYVVVYDAEDRPEPDQLRQALRAFAAGGPRLACVQARLNIFNARQSWLTGLFAVEYSALFDAMLPALQALRLPIPLGGTSNHFPRALLMLMNGWDPYNVTEDADLGIRIARLGLDVAVIRSTTWEEAPASFRQWRNQRTRWLKGWMQTYLVHTRNPGAMLRELGLGRTLGFHVYLGGLLLSALVHPWFYAALTLVYVLDLKPDLFDASFGPAVTAVAIGNLVVGYLVSIVIGLVTAHRRGHRIALAALLMPVYWLLISLAAYRALRQLYRDPYLWEKTAHGEGIED